MRIRIFHQQVAAIVLMSLCACGPSHAELELQRIQQDEDRQAFRTILNDSLSRVEQTIARYEADLDRMKGELAVAKDRLARASEFKLLRTSAEREAQILEATTELERINRLVEENEPNLRAWKELKGRLRAELNN